MRLLLAICLWLTRGQGPKDDPVSPLPFQSRTPDFVSGPSAPVLTDVASPGLKPRGKQKSGVRDVDIDKKSADGLFSLESAKAEKNATAAKPGKVKFELLDTRLQQNWESQGSCLRPNDPTM